MSPKRRFAHRILKALPRVLGLTTFLIAFIAAVHPDIRMGVREILSGKDRKVLSVLRDVPVGDRVVDIVKVRTFSGLALEIYDRSSGSYSLIGRAELNDRTDAYFMLQGKAANLFISDLDNDGEVEISAPTYDKNLVAHLNVFNIRQFENKIEIVQGP